MPTSATSATQTTPPTLTPGAPKPDGAPLLAPGAPPAPPAPPAPLRRRDGRRALRTLWLPLLALALNLLLGRWLLLRLDLPFVLEHVGTVLAGLLLGPVAGGIVGALSMALQAALLGGAALPGEAMLPGDAALLTAALPALWVGWVAGVAGRRGALRKPLLLLAAALVATAGAALLSALLAAAPGGGGGFWASLGAGLAAALQRMATPAGALQALAGPFASFAGGALLAWLLRRHQATAPARDALPPGEAIGRALLGWVVALGICWFFLPAFGRPLFALFFLPVLLSVWRLGPPAGARAGLVAATLGALGGLLLIAPPLGRGPLLATDWLWLLLFLGVALYAVFVTDALQRRTRELAVAGASHRQADARLAAIAAGVDETLLFVSPNRTVSLVNARFQDLFAERAADVQGHTLADAEPLFDRAFADPAHFAHFVSETLAEPTGDDSAALEQAWPVARELAIRALPVQGSEEYYGRLYLLRDRTREREIEQLYARVAAVVNDELRAPTARMRTLASTLLDGAAGDLSEPQARLLTTLRTLTERQLGFIEQMSEAARLESEQLRLTPGEVDLNALLHNVAAAVRPLLHEKRQTLTVDIAPDLPPIQADSTRLTQALTNLLSNAHKFTGRGGWVRIEARLEGRGSPRSRAKLVRIAVSDGGIGIAHADQKHLFERFYRVENEQTRTLVGTGLGLTMVASIARLHGGEVEVSSTPGQGSSFAMVLPLVQTTAPQPVRPAAPPPLEAEEQPAAPAPPALVEDATIEAERIAAEPAAAEPAAAEPAVEQATVAPEPEAAALVPAEVEGAAAPVTAAAALVPAEVEGAAAPVTAAPETGEQAAPLPPAPPGLADEQARLAAAIAAAMRVTTPPNAAPAAELPITEELIAAELLAAELPGADAPADALPAAAVDVVEPAAAALDAETPTADAEAAALFDEAFGATLGDAPSLSDAGPATAAIGAEEPAAEEPAPTSDAPAQPADAPLQIPPFPLPAVAYDPLEHFAHTHPQAPPPTAPPTAPPADLSSAASAPVLDALDALDPLEDPPDPPPVAAG